MDSDFFSLIMHITIPMHVMQVAVRGFALKGFGLPRVQHLCSPMQLRLLQYRPVNATRHHAHHQGYSGTWASHFSLWLKSISGMVFPSVFCRCPSFGGSFIKVPLYYHHTLHYTWHLQHHSFHAETTCPITALWPCHDIPWPNYSSLPPCPSTSHLPKAWPTTVYKEVASRAIALFHFQLTQSCWRTLQAHGELGRKCISQSREHL